MACPQALGLTHHPLWQVNPVGPDQAGQAVVRTDQERQAASFGQIG
ncbi:MAG: hypothetical protein RJA87_580 [Pseudomonadota bacterium]